MLKVLSISLHVTTDNGPHLRKRLSDGGDDVASARDRIGRVTDHLGVSPKYLGHANPGSHRGM